MVIACLPAGRYLGYWSFSEANIKIHRYIIVLLILLIPQGALAKSPSLKKRTSEIEATYKRWNNLSADFTQETFVEILGKTIKKRGALNLKKGGKLRIAYAGKNEKTYLSDGKVLWIFIPGDDASIETYVADSETIPKEALNFLGGFGKISKQFKVSKSDAFPEHKPDFTALHLVPRAKGALYKSLDVLFGPDNLFTELIINNVSGNRSHYRFSNVRTDLGLSDAIFTRSRGKATPDTLPE